MVALSVVDAVRTYLRAVDGSGIPVSFGVVFGSQARGTPTDLSDIDLLVVSPRFDGVKDHSLVNRLWHLTVRHDHRIEPIAIKEKIRGINDSLGLVTPEIGTPGAVNSPSDLPPPNP